VVEESPVPPLSISADAEQINPKDAVFEYHSPAIFCPSPSTEQYFWDTSVLIAAGADAAKSRLTI
jgi:hypothetical protein